MKKLCIVLVVICISSFILSGIFFSLSVGSADFNSFSKNINEEYTSAFNGENIKVSGIFRDLVIIPYDESDVKVTLRRQL